MADHFAVNHAGYSEANMGLAQQVHNLDTIMEDLNNTLNHIAQASNGRATPLWQEQQSAWNRAYAEMKMQLNSHTQSSFNVAQTFQDGDNNGARLF